MVNPDQLTKWERDSIVAWHTRQQPVWGLKLKGMSKGRAKAYVAALEQVADEAWAKAQR